MIGVCADAENEAAVRQAGADFLEENVQNFLLPGSDDSRFAPYRELAAELSLPILAANCFLPGNLPCVGPAVDEAALLAYAATTVSRVG